MAIGYQSNDKCFSTVTLAVENWQSKYPYQDGNTVYSLTSLTNNSTGLMTFSVRNSAGTSIITNGTAQLRTCIDQGLLQDYPIQDIFFASAYFLAFAIGLLTGKSR